MLEIITPQRGKGDDTIPAGGKLSIVGRRDGGPPFYKEGPQGVSLVAVSVTTQLAPGGCVQVQKLQLQGHQIRSRKRTLLILYFQAWPY